MILNSYRNVKYDLEITTRANPRTSVGTRKGKGVRNGSLADGSIRGDSNARRTSPFFLLGNGGVRLVGVFNLSSLLVREQFLGVALGVPFLPLVPLFHLRGSEPVPLFLEDGINATLVLAFGGIEGRLDGFARLVAKMGERLLALLGRFGGIVVGKGGRPGGVVRIHPGEAVVSGSFVVGSFGRARTGVDLEHVLVFRFDGPGGVLAVELVFLGDLIDFFENEFLGA